MPLSTNHYPLFERCREELGEPDALFSVSPKRFWAKFGLGLLLLAYGVGANIVAWDQGLWGVDHVSFLVLFAPPLTGFSILRHLYNTRGLRVLFYPNGIMRLQRSEIESYPWDEIDEIRLKTEQGAIVVQRDDDGQIRDCWVVVDSPVFQISQAATHVRRADGVQAKFTPALAEYPELVERIQRATFRILWANFLAARQAGEPLAFGAWVITEKGLKADKTVIAWRDIQSIELRAKSVVVKNKVAKVVTIAQELESLPNPHLALAWITEARRLVTQV